MLRAVALKWEIEQINFIVENHGSVMESDFYAKLENLNAQVGKKDKFSTFTDHVTQVCGAHDLDW